MVNLVYRTRLKNKSSRFSSDFNNRINAFYASRIDEPVYLILITPFTAVILSSEKCPVFQEIPTIYLFPLAGKPILTP